MNTNPENQKRDPNSTAIQKVGAAIIKDKKVLVVRKKSHADDEYYMAGGKMEGEETQRETLERELKEELDVEVTQVEYLGSFEDIAVFEQKPIVIHAYHVNVKKEPSAQSEIKEYAWIDRDFEAKGFEVSSIMAKKVIPELIKRDLM